MIRVISLSMVLLAGTLLAGANHQSTGNDRCGVQLGGGKSNTGSPQSIKCPSGHLTKNLACCAFYPLRDDLQANLFKNSCGEDSHEVLRLSFHDAAGYSVSRKFKGNGADGSIIVFESIETKYSANVGTDDAVDGLKPYLKYNVSAGDLIQFASAVGISNCPGAPQLEFLAGRPPPTAPASDGTLPTPQQSVSDILSRVADMGLGAEDMVNLLASHSIGKADHVDPAHSDVPFDSTPSAFDTQFFLEMLMRGKGYPGTQDVPDEVPSAMADEGIMRLKSDWAFAHDQRTACQWQSFVNDQQLMMDSFKQSMAKMAIIGHQRDQLIDCSEVIPIPPQPITKGSYYPPGYSKKDIEQSCRFPFPKLGTAPSQH